MRLENRYVCRVSDACIQRIDKRLSATFSDKYRWPKFMRSLGSWINKATLCYIQYHACGVPSYKRSEVQKLYCAVEFICYDSSKCSMVICGDVLALLERCYWTTDRYEKEQISPLASLEARWLVPAPAQQASRNVRHFRTNHSTMHLQPRGIKATLLSAHNPTVLTNPEPCSTGFLSTRAARSQQLGVSKMCIRALM